MPTTMADGPTTVRCERACRAPVDALWSSVLDLPASTAPVPLTTATSDPPPVQLGWSFVARTGLGPVGFDDEMLVTGLEAPGEGTPGLLRLVKIGRLLDGWAEIVVSGDGEGSHLTWTEDVGPRAVPLRAIASGVGAPLARAATTALLERMVTGVIARAESTPAQ